MKLHLPDILRHFDSKPVGMMFADGSADLLKPKDKKRIGLLRTLAGQMHRAEKFIFDSGSDQDPESVKAVRETALAMMGFDLFHLPAPAVWIEDPFDSDTDPEGRNRFYYLVEEHSAAITVVMISAIDPREIAHLPAGMQAGMPKYTVLGGPLLIDLAHPEDRFLVTGASQFVSPEMAKHLGEAVYAVKKFVVTLAAEQTVRERVEPPRLRGAAAAGPRREYPHTVIRIPTYAPEPGAGEARGPQGKRRMGLVAGYVWGKNTRPLPEQRWIAPYWRGDATLGLVAPKVRIVTAAKEAR